MRGTDLIESVEGQLAQAFGQSQRHHDDINGPAPATAQLFLLPQGERSVLAVLEHHGG